MVPHSLVPSLLALVLATAAVGVQRASAADGTSDGPRMRRIADVEHLWLDAADEGAPPDARMIEVR